MDNRDWMEIWGQIPLRTKVSFLLLLGLVIILSILVLVRTEGFHTEFPGLQINLPLFGEVNLELSTPSAPSITGPPDGEGQDTPVSDSGAPMAIAKENVEIYFGPGSFYDSIGYLEGGKAAQVIGRSADGVWWVIRVPYYVSGQGWVASAGVDVQNGDDVPVVDYEESEQAEITPVWIPTVTAVANVNVRSGPGLGYNKLGVLANGQSAEVVGKSEDGFWWVIKLPLETSGQGWISIDYVIPRNAENVPIIEILPEAGFLLVPTPRDNAPLVEALTMINIRSGPGVEYAVLAQLEPGQIAEIVGVSVNGSWYAIRVEGTENGYGWVALVYVRTENAEELPVLR